MGVEDRKAREFQRREAEILEAALHLFRGEDWQAVTVEQIAQHAEIGKGTIYKHFASKDEIYARLALDFQRAMLARVRGIDANLPIDARFRAILRIGWEAHLAAEELHRLVMYCERPEFRHSVSRESAAAFAVLEQERRDLIRGVLEEGIAKGVFANKPPELLVFGVHAAFWGSVQIIWGGYLPELDRETYLDELAEFILAGLRPRSRT